MQNLRQKVLAEAKHQLALNLYLLKMLQDDTPLEELAAALHSHLINVFLSESP